MKPDSIGVAAASLLLGMVLLFNATYPLPAAEWGVLLIPMLLISWRFRPMRPLFWLLIGFFWAAIQADLRLSVALPDELEGRDLQMSGAVVGLPQRKSSGSVRFLFQIKSLQHQDEVVHFPALVRLNWYKPPMVVTAGQQLQFTARLKQPHGFSNPGSFEWERWLFERGIRATGYVRAEPFQILRQPDGGVTSLRERLSQWIREVDSSGLLAALAVGDRQGISPRQWSLLRNTGISHLIAISGLHIGLVATLLFFLFRWGWAALPRLLLYLPAQQAGAVGALLGALSYAALAGFSVPTQRALIMVAVVMVALLLRRALTRWRGYSLALSAVLLFDPFVVLSAGFWLSFAAVGWILLALPERSEQSGRSEYGGGVAGWLLALVKIQLVLLIGMLPLLLYLFQQGSLVAPLVNLIVVPWISLLVVPLTLLSALLYLLALPGAVQLLEFTAQLLQWVMPLVEWFDALDFSHFTLRQPALWMALLALGAVWMVLSPRFGKARWLAMLLWLPMLLWPPERPPQGEAWVTVLDVGQGLAVVVEGHEQVLVYDTGDRFSATFDAGSAVLIPFLRARGWQQIDLLVVGHGDRDHIGGLAALSKAFPIVEAVSSVPDKVRQSTACHAGQQWQWSGGVVVEMLHPQVDDRLQGNDRSCVLRVTAAGKSLLLTGDIEAAAERLLLERFPARIDVDALVVPHHGSETSSTAEWIEQVSPRWGVVPVGYRNRYRLPRAGVIERYQRANVGLWSSADSGAVEIRLGERLQISSWRMAHLRIWSDLPSHYSNTGKIPRSPSLME